MCKYYYYNKGPFKNHFLIWRLSTLPDFGRRGLTWRGWGGCSGVQSRLLAEREEGRGWGLDRFTAEGCFSFCLRLFPAVAAARETASGLSLALLRHIKASFSSLEPLGFEVGFFQRLNPKGEPAFKCPSCTWVTLEALPLRRCVT